MTKLSFHEDFTYRVSYAAKCIMDGTRTRHRDSCYENDDGDLVVVALVRRARNNPKLMTAILKDWGGAIPKDWLDLEAQYQHTPTKNLKVLAKHMREAAKVAFEKQRQTWETAK